MLDRQVDDRHLFQPEGSGQGIEVYYPHNEGFLRIPFDRLIPLRCFRIANRHDHPHETVAMGDTPSEILELTRVSRHGLQS